MERLGCGDELNFEQRYDRHLRLSEIGSEGQKKLRDASVLLIGVGGLGSPIALYLAAAGIGRIGLVDDDRVSLSNLQRQVLYSEEEIGKLKVECARKRLLQNNSHLQVNIYPERLDENNVARIFRDYDMVIDGCDNYETRYLIDRMSKTFGMPYIYGSIGEFHGQVAVFNCLDSCSYRDLFPDPQTTPQVPKGVMGVMPGVIGTLQASEAIKLITGAGEPLINKMLTIDLLTMEMKLLMF